MIEEPYRWVEAIANRREYIETQLASGSPIAAVGYRDGILFLTLGQARQNFAVLSGTRQSTELMESFLKAEHAPDATFEAALKTALDAWSIGHMALQKDDGKELPERAAVTKHRQEQLATAGIEAAMLE